MIFLQTASIQEQALEFLPDISNTSFGFVALVIFILIFLAIIVSVGLYFLINALRFNKKVVILEDVSGSDDLEPIGKDKARLVKVGKGGTEVLYLKKRKVYRGAYGKRMGKNTYYFAIGSDGYWYNSTLGSLASGMNKIGIKPTNVNMRYQNESLMELIKERYDKPSFWAQYGQILMNIAFFMIIAVMFWLYFDSFKDTSPALIEASKTLKETADVLRQTVGGLDSLKATGGLN